MEFSKNDRRTFLRQVFAGLLAAFVAPALRLQNALAAMVSPTDTMAKALGYVPVATASADWKAKKDKKANCSTCNFYTSTGKDSGKCSIITSGDVSAKGWCRSYAKKAAAPKTKKS